MQDIPSAPIVEQFLGEYLWIAIIIFIALVFKSTIENLVAGLFVFLGNDYNDDDAVYIGDERGRIVRMSPWSTTFYIYDIHNGKVVSGRKMVVANTELKTLRISKPLPMLDLPKDMNQ